MSSITIDAKISYPWICPKEEDLWDKINHDKIEKIAPDQTVEESKLNGLCHQLIGFLNDRARSYVYFFTINNKGTVINLTYVRLTESTDTSLVYERSDITAHGPQSTPEEILKALQENNELYDATPKIVDTQIETWLHYMRDVLDL